MRRYETVFILRPDLGENQTRDTVKRFEGIVAASGGEVIETDEWGSRELAYRIGNERRGYYVRLDYAAPGGVVAELERNLKLADNVLRYLSVMVEEGADAVGLRAEVEAKKRRAEEAKAVAEQARAAAAAAAAQATVAAQPETPATPEIAAESPVAAQPEAPDTPETTEPAATAQPEAAVTPEMAESAAAQPEAPAGASPDDAERAQRGATDPGTEPQGGEQQG